MLNISEAAKNEFGKKSSTKTVSITIKTRKKTINVDAKQIIQESMVLEESIMDSNDLEIIGCQSSKFEIEIAGINDDIKNAEISVSINASETEDVPLFFGYIDSAESTGNKKRKKIVAYDYLNKLGDSEIGDVDWDWYNTLSFPMSIGDFRYNLFTKLKNDFGLDQEDVPLPADSFITRGLDDRVYNPNIIYSDGDYCKYNNNQWYYRIVSTGKADGPQFDFGNWSLIKNFSFFVSYQKDEKIIKNKRVYNCIVENSTKQKFLLSEWELMEIDVSDYQDEDTVYLDLLKEICQINVAFGIVGRNKKFKYLYPNFLGMDNGFYPGTTSYLPLLPTNIILENSDSTSICDEIYYPHYKTLDYEEFKIKKITKVILREYQKDKNKASVGDGKCKYIIQSNMFIKDIAKEERVSLATEILNVVNGLSYTPFEATTDGLPYVECGDSVSFYAYDFEQSQKQGKDVFVLKNYIVFKRVLSGIQNLMDEMSANGTKGNVHISGESNRGAERNANDRINNLEKNQLQVLSVDELPKDAKEHTNTIYLIRGEVTVT